MCADHPYSYLIRYANRVPGRLSFRAQCAVYTASTSLLNSSVFQETAASIQMYLYHFLIDHSAGRSIL